MPELKQEFEEFLKDIHPLLAKTDDAHASTEIQLADMSTVVQALNDALVWAEDVRSKNQLYKVS